MTAKTKAQIAAEIASSITTNGTGRITGAVLATALSDINDSVLTYRGAWDGGISYVANDVVTLDGAAFIATIPSTGNRPPSAAWQVFAGIPAPVVSPLTPHVGFGSAPFGANFYKVDGIYSTDFNPQCPLVEGGAGVATYYIDKATGSDSNPGTSSQPFATINKACTIGRGVTLKMLLKVKGGTYYLTENFNNFVPQATTLACVSWDGNPVICSNELTGLTWTLDTGATYSASVAGQGFANFSSTAWDGAFANAFGDYAALTPQSSQAACESTAGSYFLDTPNSRIYVHTQNGRAPDTNVHVFEANGTPGQFRDFGGSPATASCYFENFVFLGGGAPFVIEQTRADYGMTGIFKNCVFKYSKLNNTILNSGNVDVAYINCVGACSYGDVFAYQAYGSTPAPRALEIGCEARFSGIAQAPSAANQGSTIHDGGKIVRLNSYYHHNQSDQIADVHDNTNTWMLGCVAGPGTQTGYAAFRCGNGTGSAKMTLDGCTSTGMTYDIISDVTCAVFTRNDTGTATNSGSGVIAPL